MRTKGSSTWKAAKRILKSLKINKPFRVYAENGRITAVGTGFKGETLEHVIAETNRYTQKKLEIADPSIGSWQIVENVKRQLVIVDDLKSSLPHAVVASNNHFMIERADYVSVGFSQRRTAYQRSIRI